MSEFKPMLDCLLLCGGAIGLAVGFVCLVAPAFV
jgi:hypothetical protein